MDPALLLLSTPTAGTRIVWVEGQTSARFTSNTCVAFFVERQQGNAIQAGILPHVFGRPLREWADLAQLLSRRQRKPIDGLKLRPALGLLSTHPCKPQLVLLELAEKRNDFTQTAAARWIRLMKNSELRFLLGDRLLRQKIDEVQTPCARHAVPILVGLGEMVSGIQKNHGNGRQQLLHQMHDDHVFRLEAAGDANVLRHTVHLIANQRAHGF